MSFYQFIDSKAKNNIDPETLFNLNIFKQVLELFLSKFII